MLNFQYRKYVRNRPKFFRKLRRSSRSARKGMSFKRFTKAPDSATTVRSGNLRGVLGKRKNVDWYHASKKFMKLGSSLGVVGRGIYSIAKYNVKRKFRSYDDPTDWDMPFADMV